MISNLTLSAEFLRPLASLQNMKQDETQAKCFRKSPRAVELNSRRIAVEKLASDKHSSQPLKRGVKTIVGLSTCPGGMKSRLSSVLEVATNLDIS
ncbi:hypothetical protein O181_029328 [Austropuccinia psidii MF-1]|uniref:Uncharacterized protein n=1 Tax=Austropuccinia psidii MF-1 TaxID=1389203 RepID=A0A9Q3CVH7_9BASI|nr:hypothetical protein [Austropuccinia psidii MF-1]